MDLSTFNDMSYGLYVVTSMDGDRPVGCVANAITQVAVTPVLVACCVNHENYTNKCITESGMFAYSILSEQSDPQIIRGFGFRSSKDNDKFADVDYELVAGVPVLKDACGYVVCRVVGTMETDTHTVFLGEAIEAEKQPGVTAPAMTYTYYHKVIKGKSPKTAPTYLQQTAAVPEPVSATGKTVTQWQCSVCGYIFEGEDLPEGYECPVCGVSAENFEKIQVEVAEDAACQWQCSVCGYIYEDPDLPADFICPVCGVGAEEFIKLV